MACIPCVAFGDASPELQALYRKYGGENKAPANILRISSVNPPVMDGHVVLYRAIMAGELPLI